MRIVNPGYEIMTPISEGGIEELKKLERIARICYKSEDKIKEDGSSAKEMVGRLIRSGHHAMLEHGSLSVLFTVDRGVSHEIVRHREASYAQESTRYCNYAQDKFGNEITVVLPYFLEDGGKWSAWHYAMSVAEEQYFELLARGCTPQEARSVLPNSLKTEIVMTANYREWRHVFSLRCSPAAHPQMREVMLPLMKDLHERIPVLFDDIYDKAVEDGWYA